MTNPPRLLVIFGGAALVVVVAIATLGTGSWWLLAVAFVIFLAAAALAIVPLGKALNQGEKPDPVTDARLDAEGDDPELGMRGSDEPSERPRDQPG